MSRFSDHTIYCLILLVYWQLHWVFYHRVLCCFDDRLFEIFTLVLSVLFGRISSMFIRFIFLVQCFTLFLFILISSAWKNHSTSMFVCIVLLIMSCRIHTYIIDRWYYFQQRIQLNPLLSCNSLWSGKRLNHCRNFDYLIYR